jgi:hypothetical protein
MPDNTRLLVLICPTRSVLVDIANVLIVLLMYVTLVIVSEFTLAIDDTVKVDAVMPFVKIAEG